jgi:putative membrane protein
VKPTAPTDPRTLLAAERTLLAWLRTGLALITFDVLIARVSLWLEQVEGVTESLLPHGQWMGAAFGLLGTLANVMAFVRYAAVRKAILAETPTPLFGFALFSFAGAVAILGALMTFFVFTEP